MFKEIVKEVNVPIVADIHFHHKRAIEAAQSGASCLRINQVILVLRREL